MKNEHRSPIIIVSGLPRSGTSLMMQILAAAGLPLLIDHSRPADQNNPRGYFEFEPVKHLKEQKDWLKQAQGKAVKIISHLLKELPADYFYKVIFMQRNLDEVIASQNKMLKNLGKPQGKLSDEQLKRYFEHHLQETFQWLSRMPNFEVQIVHFEQLFSNPQQILDEISLFLSHPIDLSKTVNVVDPQLYRTRKKNS